MDSILNKEMSNASRDTYWDFLKGIAIFLVLLGHSIQYGGGGQWYSSGSYFDCFLFELIYSFHMPLFIFISGFFFQKSINKYQPKVLLLKKIKSLLIPITSFATLYLFFRVFVQHYHFTLSLAFNTYITTLWYLWTYLYCCIVTILIHRYWGDRWYIYIVTCFLSLFLPNVYNFDAYTFLYPFFLLGYFTKKEGYMTVIKSLKPHYLIAVFFSFVVLLLFWNKDCFYYNSGTSILPSMVESNLGGVLSQIVINTYRLLCGLLGVIIVLYLSLQFCRLMEEKRKALVLIQEFFVHLGLVSMGVYCFQDFLWVLFYLLFNTICCPSAVSILTSFVAVFFLSYCLTRVTKLFGLSSFLLLGGR